MYVSGGYLRNKVGFTLIELLAVIVILAIIAIIAVPIVLDIISDTRKSAEVRSAEMYVEALNNSIGNKYLKDPTFKLEDGKYDVMSDGSVCIGITENDVCTGDKIEVEINGEIPSGGYIDIVEKKITFYDLKIGSKYISKIEYTPEECFEMNGSTITRFVCAPMIWDSEQHKAVENKNKINNITDVVIPSEINGVKITRIGDYAFRGNQITSVEIPNTVTQFGYGVFYTNQLTTVIIPNKIKSLTTSTFGYNQLTNIIISSSVTTINANVFRGNKLVNIIIPNSVIEIRDYSFIENPIESITIKNKQENVTIGPNAFGSFDTNNIVWQPVEE